MIWMFIFSFFGTILATILGASLSLVLKSENNYKSNAVDYYVNSSIDGVRLSGNLPVLFTKMINKKNELYFRL